MSMFNTKNSRIKAIGVMSGTSMDAIDVSLLETDGENHVKPLRFQSFPIDKALKVELLSLIKQPELILNGDLSAITDAVTRAHVKAVLAFGADDADIVGFHGQTVLHRPRDKITMQLFNGKLAHSLLQKPVVCNFRANDVQQGGEGAPLVPIYHQALASELPKPCVFLNLGGVANITFMGEVLGACDTGTASALIDDFMRERAGRDYDHNGETASRGKIDEALLKKALQHPYFTRKYPKSLDRNSFHIDTKHLSLEDGAATLTAFTVQSIALSVKMLPETPKAIYVMGGGRKNAFMMRELANALPCPLINSDNIGVSGDSVEADCFAHLAVRRMKNMPISFPLTTGVREPLTGGDIFR